jgi:hypothetical protein
MKARSGGGGGVRPRDSRPPPLWADGGVVCPPPHDRHRIVLPQQKAERHRQEIAGEQTIDRLAHRCCVLLHIEEEDHHQLAGEQHGRSGRNHAERQLHIKDRGKIGLDEVHDAEGRDKDPETQPGTKVQKPDHRRDVDQCLADEENKVGVWHVLEKVPFPQAPLTRKLEENFTGCPLLLDLSVRKSAAFGNASFPAYSAPTHRRSPASEQNPQLYSFSMKTRILDQWRTA